MTDAGVNTRSASRRSFDLVLRQSEILVPRVADSFRERDRLEVVAEASEVVLNRRVTCAFLRKPLLQCERRSLPLGHRNRPQNVRGLPEFLCG
jgi:hypothetical protein